jgi:hypothetical protein
MVAILGNCCCWILQTEKKWMCYIHELDGNENMVLGIVAAAQLAAAACIRLSTPGL